jgi:spore maturation protein CgeB
MPGSERGSRTMNGPPQVAFFGSSLLSAYGNCAATYHRGIVKAMARRGYRMTFYEPDVVGRRETRDLEAPEWATVVVYRGDDAEGPHRAIEEARRADILIKAGGVGVFDDLLEAALASAKTASNCVVFWDVDPPATLERVSRDARDPFRALIPKYDVILTSGGGESVRNAYAALGARRCVAVYSGLDPETHYEVAAEPRFAAELSLLANRTPDRDRRVAEFLFRPATLLRHRRFLLGGSGWTGAPAPGSVIRTGHVATGHHNAFNCSARAILSLVGDGMAAAGFCPGGRVFEAAGAAACVITDPWEGLERFLEPGREVLVAGSGDEVVEVMAELTPEKARRIGRAARLRVLREHTYAHRAEELDNLFGAS